MERAVSPEGWVMVVGGDVRRTHSELPPLRSNIGVQAAVLHNNQLCKSCNHDGSEPAAEQAQVDLFEVAAEGNCFFLAVVAVLRAECRLPADFDIGDDDMCADAMREATLDYMLANVNTLYDREVLMTMLDTTSHQNFASYIDGMRSSTAWAGEPEVVATAELLGQRIKVIGGGVTLTAEHHDDDVIVLHLAAEHYSGVDRSGNRSSRSRRSHPYGSATIFCRSLQGHTFARMLSSTHDDERGGMMHVWVRVDDVGTCQDFDARRAVEEDEGRLYTRSTVPSGSTLLNSSETAALDLTDPVLSRTTAVLGNGCFASVDQSGVPGARFAGKALPRDDLLRLGATLYSFTLSAEAIAAKAKRCPSRAAAAGGQTFPPPVCVQLACNAAAWSSDQTGVTIVAGNTSSATAAAQTTTTPPPSSTVVWDGSEWVESSPRFWWDLIRQVRTLGARVYLPGGSEVLVCRLPEDQQAATMTPCYFGFLGSALGEAFSLAQTQAALSRHKSVEIAAKLEVLTLLNVGKMVRARIGGLLPAVLADAALALAIAATPGLGPTSFPALPTTFSLPISTLQLIRWSLFQGGGAVVDLGERATQMLNGTGYGLADIVTCCKTPTCSNDHPRQPAFASLATSRNTGTSLAAKHKGAAAILSALQTAFVDLATSRNTGTSLAAKHKGAAAILSALQTAFVDLATSRNTGTSLTAKHKGAATILPRQPAFAGLATSRNAGTALAAKHKGAATNLATLKTAFVDLATSRNTGTSLAAKHKGAAAILSALQTAFVDAAIAIASVGRVTVVVFARVGCTLLKVNGDAPNTTAKRRCGSSTTGLWTSQNGAKRADAGRTATLASGKN
eukprot:gene7054-13752_t